MSKKNLELDDKVVEQLLIVLRQMSHAGRGIVKQMKEQGAELNEGTLEILAHNAVVQIIYNEVKKANKMYEVGELEKLFALDAGGDTND
jgi:hypothetical protein